jgi:hypothetical protein
MKDIAYLMEQIELNLAGIEADLAAGLIRTDSLKSNCNSSRVLLRELKQCLSVNPSCDEARKEVMKK